MTQRMSRSLPFPVNLILFLLSVAALSSSSSAAGGAAVDNEEPPQPSCAADSISSQQFRVELMETILKEDWNVLDETLEHSITQLKSRGAHRCWHKHSTFLEHLLNTHNILQLWKVPQTSARMGLFHSAYSNSYVNLALLNPNNITERQLLQSWIGTDAEELVYLFCSIDRQALVVETLLKQGSIPTEGVTVPHLRHQGEEVHLSYETLRQLIVFTMADISDQYFGWQDELFGGGGEQGSMVIPHLDFSHRHQAGALWPGPSRPGLWMSYVSQLGQLLKQTPNDDSSKGVDDEFVVPPVFRNCTVVLSVEDDARARDLYWSIVSATPQPDMDTILETLTQAHVANRFVFEPLVLLAQKYLEVGDFSRAKKIAERALELQHEWGTCWDKRMSFGAWLAWTRVLHQRAAAQEPWPTNSWDVNNFGMVAAASSS